MSDIRKWLDSIGLGHYADAFEENAIEWRHLSNLDQDALKELGVRAIGHRMTLLEAAQSLGNGAADGALQESAPPAAKLTPGGDPERRQLTVMFADLVGSTELSQRFDPDQTRRQQ